MALVNYPASGSCYKYGDHMSYTGNVAVTIYGVQCASWTLHGYSNVDFPDNSVQAASNYCRNPGSEETGPWCYDINDNMGHCNLLFCSTAGRCSLSSLLITVVTITNTYQHFIGCVIGFWKYEGTQNSRKLWQRQVLHHHELFSCFHTNTYTINRAHCLIHCGLVIPYGNTDMGQHWLTQCLAARRHQAITWTNVDFSSMESCGTHQFIIKCLAYQ